MKVFISWSGDKSYLVAEALRDWLPNIIQALNPFLSSKDTPKGVQWREQISKNIDESSVGVICVTADNLTAPWILFEAGALSKSVKDSSAYVCTYLLDLNPADVIEPLAQFQHTKAEKEDTRKLIITLNDAIRTLGHKGALTESQLNKTFDMWWPDLEASLKSIIEEETTPSAPEREERELLEEILDLVRALTRQPHATQYYAAPATPVSSGLVYNFPPGTKAFTTTSSPYGTIALQGYVPPLVECEKCGNLYQKGNYLTPDNLCDGCRGKLPEED